MSRNKSNKPKKVAWIVTKFIDTFMALGMPETAFEYEVTGRHIVKFKELGTEAMWVGYIEGHKMTKNRLFGQFIIGKHQEDGRPVFTEVPYVHQKFGGAMDEFDRVRKLAPNETFALYQCVKVAKPRIVTKTEPVPE